ncbi:MAG: McrC family protein [Chitinophagales bacterium]|nr:McrC family protein [Chitinophagales bacterium]
MRITVYEYQTLRIGEEGFTSAHWEAMAIFHEQVSDKYYSLVNKGVRFLNFVGVLQLGNITIEILPKLKNDNTSTKEAWQRALIDMLRICKLLRVDSLSSARQALRPDAILELYFGIFLDETEWLVRQGLLKEYYREQGDLNTLKGRLLHGHQLRKNTVHKERFYTEYETYNYDHLLNRILYAVLKLTTHCPLDQVLLAKARRLLQQFPPVSPPDIKNMELDSLMFSRKTAPYRTAVEAGLLLLKNYHPALAAGSHNVLALLFDMNLLFEEYIYRRLFRLQTPSIKVYRQMSRPFWGRRYLRPDIVLEINGIRYIIDTKWKIPSGSQPGMHDLRQVFTYIRQFKAKRGILLYPGFSKNETTSPVPFTHPDGGDDDIFCQIVQLPLMKDGQLNLEIGEQLLTAVTQTTQ